MPHVFISYIRENQREVDRLCNSLKANNVRIWLDREQLLAGQRWQDAIRSAIRTGAFFIACFSREYLEKERSYMNEELSLAIEEIRLRPTSLSWFIPVLLSGDDVPDRTIRTGETLRDLQWVNLSSDWDEGIRAILRTIHSHESTPQASGPSYKVCYDCNGSATQRKKQYSASAGFISSDELEACSTCKGTGKVPTSFRKGALGLKTLVDCWNCNRTGITYNDLYTHCPKCGADLFP
jgi:hypothetical protein